MSTKALTRGKRISPWIAISPAFLFLLVVTMFPFIYTIYTSLFDWYLPSGRSFSGFRNYSMVITSSDFLPSLLKSLYFTIGCLGLEHLFGFALALMLSRINYSRGLLTTLFMLPMMLPPVVSAMIWRLMYRDTGLLNYLIGLLGIPPQIWINGPLTVIPSIILVDVWQWTPFVMLILLGGLNSISPDVHDAAEVDGANFPRKLWNVIIPLLKPFFVVTLLLRFIYVFTTFDIIMSLTKGGPGHSSATLYFIGYLASFEFLQMGRGATWNLVIFIITMVVSMLLVNKALKRD